MKGDAVNCVFIILIVIGVFLSMPRHTHVKRRSGNSGPKYPRIVGYDGVWCNGYHDKNGNWIEPGFDLAIVEQAERCYTEMDRIEALKQGIPEKQ